MGCGPLPVREDVRLQTPQGEDAPETAHPGTEVRGRLAGRSDKLALRLPVLAYSAGALRPAVDHCPQHRPNGLYAILTPADLRKVAGATVRVAARRFRRARAV